MDHRTYERAVLLLGRDQSNTWCASVECGCARHEYHAFDGAEPLCHARSTKAETHFLCMLLTLRRMVWIGHPSLLLHLAPAVCTR